MNEDRFNMEVRKFLKEVGVTSQREIERVVREGAGAGGSLRLRMVLTSPDTPPYNTSSSIQSSWTDRQRAAIRRPSPPRPCGAERLAGCDPKPTFASGF